MKGKTSKFMDAEGYEGEGNEREGWRIKIKLKTLGTEICENMKTLYIKKTEINYIYINN